MKRSWIALALVGAGLAGCQDSPPAEARTFEYAVGTLDCHPTGLGGAVPKGRFCTLGITVHNVSDQPTRPGIAFASVYDTAGTAYLPDAVALVRAGSHLFNELAPGARITDRLIYDVPKTSTITSVELHESPAAPETRINLSERPTT